MSGKSLSDLDLHDEPIEPKHADDLPEFGGWAPPPQPGPMRFKLPPILDHIWEPYEANGHHYLRAIFDKDNPLVIVRSVGGVHNNTPYQTRFANQRRQRGQFEASDLDYVLKALGEKQLPTSNRGYAEALQKYPGGEFDADNTYSWSCNANRDRYGPDGSGGTTKEEGVKGCGARYYQAEKTKKEGAGIAKVNGEYPYEIQCRCGAIVRAFANLDGIRK